MLKLYSIDFKILDWIQSNCRCALLDSLMPAVTALGNGGAIWLLFSAVCLASAGYTRCGAAMLGVLMATVLIGNWGIKTLFARPRPCDLTEDPPRLIRRPRDPSFPSGHTMSSFAAAAVLMAANPRLGVWAYCLAGLIGFSRLYLYVHFPSDVAAGAVLGMLLAWPSVILLGVG